MLTERAQFDRDCDERKEACFLSFARILSDWKISVVLPSLPPFSRNAFALLSSLRCATLIAIR